MPRANVIALHTRDEPCRPPSSRCQIRTEEMHRTAEEASPLTGEYIGRRWRGRHGARRGAAELDRNWSMAKGDDATPTPFASSLKWTSIPTRLPPSRPRGKVVVTRRWHVVDFAYTIHTEVAHTCVER